MRLGLLLFLGSLALCPNSPVGSDAVLPGSSPNLGQREVVLRGNTACVDKEGRPIAEDRSCPQGSTFQFKDEHGNTFSFEKDDPLAAIFSDSQVRQRLLQITAREHPGNRLELIAVQSVKSGRLYDISYYCDVCNITLYAPGPCPCCGKELKFTETPASQP